MNKTEAQDAMKELTMLLIYLSCFTQNNRFSKSRDFYAWKGYNFDILNKLDDADFIRQGDRPSRSKSVYITDSGVALAKELMEKYNITDWPS